MFDIDSDHYSIVAYIRILFIEAAGNYVKVITSKDTISVRQKISELLLTLNHDDLIQVDKSFAVSKKRIKSIVVNRIFIEEHTISIGKTYKSSINQFLK